MGRAWITCGLVMLLWSACATAPRPSDAPHPPSDSGPSEALMDLADAWWEHLMVANPTWATSLGDRRFDHRLSDLSPEAIHAHIETAQRLLDQLQQIDGAALTRPGDRITLEVLGSILRRTLEGRVCQAETWNVDQLYGLQVQLPGLVNAHTIRGEADIATLVARYDAVPRLVSQHLDHLDRGVAQGWTAFHVAVDRVIDQLKGMVNTPKSESPFVSGVALPEDWDSERKAKAHGQLSEAVERSVYPALTRYLTYLSERYRPVARQTPGISTLPEGASCYAKRVYARTGSTASPQAIHQLGLEELQGLETAMRAIAKEVSGREDLAAFVSSLKTRSDQIAESEAALLALAEDAVRRAEKAMPKAFGRLPKTPVVVKPIEAYRAASAPAAYYYTAPADKSRPGVFYLNTANLPERLLYNQEALAFHEAVPGHHLQLSLAAEVDALPDFQRRQSQTAYTEGWALYAELLADEMGLYSSQLSRFGMLNYQAWRACRLVVDTGLHALGWTRQEAIEFMVAHTALTRAEIVVEVDRYITWPGQALAYMLGRMAFQRLRARAESALGETFDLRAFHDEVLAYGGIPMDVLEGVVERWIAAHQAH